MNELSRDQQRDLVRIWDTTGPELERLRRQALRGLPYRWEDVDAVLAMAHGYDGPQRRSSGLVEMQRLFMKGRERRCHR